MKTYTEDHPEYEDIKKKYVYNTKCYLIEARVTDDISGMDYDQLGYLHPDDGTFMAPREGGFHVYTDYSIINTIKYGEPAFN